MISLALVNKAGVDGLFFLLCSSTDVIIVVYPVRCHESVEITALSEQLKVLLLLACVPDSLALPALT